MSTSTAPAVAPTISASPPPPPPPPPPPVLKFNCTTFICYDNEISDNQIVTTLWFAAIVGAVCLLVFGSFRKHIRIYSTRLFLPQVHIKPPRLQFGGIQQLWTWLYPVFRTTDVELLHTAGMDSLMMSWVTTLALQILLPMTVAGCAILLPVNLSQNRIALEAAADATVSVSKFSTLTLSNIPRGSGLFWIPFVYVYLSCAWIMWLLVKYYSAYVILRQRFLTSGEASINEWHEQYMQGSLDKTGKEEGKGVLAALKHFKQLFDPSEMETIMEDEASMTVGPATAALSQMTRMSSARSGNLPSSRLLSTRSHNSRHGFRGGPHIPSSSRDPSSSQPQGGQGLALGSARGPGPHRPGQQHVGFADSAAVPAGRPAQHHAGIVNPAVVPVGIPTEANLQQNAAAEQVSGVEMSHVSVSDIVSMSSISMQPAYGLQPPVPFQQPGPPQALSDQETVHAAGAALTHNPVYRAELTDTVGLQPALPGAGAAGSGPGPVAEGMEEHHVELSRFSVAASVESCDVYGAPAPMLISRYERSPPPETIEGKPAREAVYKWWRTDNMPATREGPRLMGKPSVRFRKVVNTTTDAGQLVAVTAQQYCVLVMDVPDLEAAARRHEERERKAASHVSWWNRLTHATATHTSDGETQNGPEHEQLAQEAAEDVEAGPAGIEKEFSVPLNQELEMQRPHSTTNLSRFRPPPLQQPGGPLTGKGPQSKGVTSPLGKSAEGPLSPFARVQASKTWSDGDPSRDPSMMGVASHAPSNHLGRYAMYDLDGDGHVTMDEIVTATFKNLFPDSFQSVLEVRNHKEVDLLLMQWDIAYMQLEKAETTFEAAGLLERPEHNLRCCGCSGDRVDSIDFWSMRVRDLEQRITIARQAALDNPPTTSYFVFFSNQKDAAIAAQTNLHAEDGHSFRVMEAPGPEEVNWSVLWRTWLERDVREVVVLPLIVLIILVPIGLFTGVVANVTVAVCNKGSRYYWSWYCGQKNVARSLFTAVLPPLLLMLWQSLVMPNVLYRFAWIESKWPSLSQMDRRICELFFFWSVFNVFLGAMFGGAIFSQLAQSIKDPASIPSLVGTALPSSSNFFINYVITQGVAMIPFRIMFPHIGVLVALFRILHICGPPKSDRDKVAALWPHSIRYGREIGVMMLIYIIALAYAATSPIILPFALIYFMFSWIFWRYNILYVSERCFESGGRVWDQVFKQVCCCMFIFEFFTACVLLSNSAFVQASILVATMTPIIYKFYRYCSIRYGHAVAHMPLETAAAAPRADVDPLVYMPPALRPGAAGWYPEYGKAWEAWGAPTYSY
ncbi:hypothetical protein WJX82_006955 [Trebouxia sp. C0006]